MSHDHSHTHETKDFGKAFAIGITLNVIFIFVEVVYGLIVNSLALIADAGISLGVVIVGLVLTFTDYYWLDPVVSILIALITFQVTWDLLKDSTSLALDAVPKGIDREGTETALMVHIDVEQPCDSNKIIDKPRLRIRELNG